MKATPQKEDNFKRKTTSKGCQPKKLTTPEMKMTSKMKTN